jgi:TRAP-type transport system periplasmic protein
MRTLKATLRIPLAMTAFALIINIMTAGPAEAVKLIRLATLAPEGSAWMITMHKIDEELRVATNGELGFKFYPNMAMGDEKDVVRKIRLGQLNGAGFTGFGLGEILPEVRILELPYVFDDEAQLDYSVNQLSDYFRQQFASKGFILLGWADVGWIYFLANHPVASPKDLQGLKVWMWEGDPLARAFYAELGKTPVALSVTDVMMALQTGMLDAAYGSPLTTLVLQWFTKVKYISDVPFTYAVGAVLIDKPTFDGLTPQQQAALSEISGKRLRELVIQSRSDNRKAYVQLQKEGLKLALSSVAQRDEMRAIGLKVQDRLAGDLYPKELLARLRQTIGEGKKAYSTEPKN